MALPGVSTEMGRDQFLQMFVAQTQNQNPLEPMNNAEFASQLAQFSSLEQLSNIGDDFEESLRFARMSSAEGLLGRAIRFMADGEEQEGTVSAARLGDEGVTVTVDGQSVPISSIVEIAAPSPSETS